MATQGWRDLINVDMPSMGPITDKTIQCTGKYAGRFRGSARVSTGRIFTDAEIEARRKNFLKMRLP